MRREELEALTKQDLLDLARRLEIVGRSALSKDGLVSAVLKAQARERKPIFGRREPPKPVVAKKAPAQKAPAAKAPAPVAKKAPAPVAKKAPAPVAKNAPAPVAKNAPAPVAAKAPAPVAARPVAPVAKMAPAPVAPVAAKAPAPATKKAPAPAALSARPRPVRETAPPKKQPAEARVPEMEEREDRRYEVAREPMLRRTPRGAPLRMPERYGTDQIVLMARDPYWLHAYWEVTPHSIERMRDELGEQWDGSRTVLRVYDYPAQTGADEATSENGEPRYDIDLPDVASSWYINVGRPDRTYRVAVGVIDRSGRFHAYARSNMVNTPRDKVSQITDEEWALPPEAFRQLYDMASPERHGGGRSSAELGLLLRERLRADWASGMLASMGMGSGELAAQKAAPRGFWFVLDAELIVYGATEPDASVTVQGKPVALRPDGTFSLRFQLPDGTQVIDATAVSADRVFRKTITPTVRRETSATEMIESDPAHRA